MTILLQVEDFTGEDGPSDLDFGVVELQTDVHVGGAVIAMDEANLSFKIARCLDEARASGQPQYLVLIIKP